MALESHRRIEDCRLELVHGDITEQEVDAIVNAANARLVGGGGVDGAIHRSGGPEIMEETDRKYPQGCPTGEAVSSTAGQLPAKYVFHAVGPQWKDGNQGEPELLATAYRSSLELARQHRCRSIAFASISTGIYGFPIERAAEIALKVAISFLREYQQPHRVRWVLFSENDFHVYRQALESLTEDTSD